MRGRQAGLACKVEPWRLDNWQGQEDSDLCVVHVAVCISVCVCVWAEFDCVRDINNFEQS